MITVLSNRSCGACTATKIALRKRGVDFKEVLAEDSPEMVEKAKQAGMKSFPVIFKGSNPIFCGFSYDRLQSLS